jgi:hypothetical protein
MRTPQTVVRHDFEPPASGSRLRRAAAIPAFVFVLVALGAFVLCEAGAVAAACPNEQTRAESEATRLPDCRAYEMVSPADKLGGAVKLDSQSSSATGLTQISADGDRVVFLSYDAFAGAPGLLVDNYESDRTASGAWLSKNITPAPDSQAQISQNAGAIDGSDDLATTITNTTASFDPLDVDGPTSLFGGAYDVYVRSPDGTVSWASRGNSDAPDADPSNAAYLGRSGDASHVIFSTPEPNLVPPASGPTQLAGGNIYDRTAGRTYLVGVDDSGNLTSACGAGEPVGVSGVSSQGAVAFVSPDPAGGSDPSCGDPAHIYLRIDDDTTLDVSSTQRTEPESGEPAPAILQGISHDGSRVFFDSSDRLTNTATVGGGLYEYDVAARTLHELVADSGANILKNLASGNPSLSGSNDGSRIYLTSTLQLTSDAPSGGGIYLVDNGVPHYVGPPGYSQVEASADGSTLAELSAEQLTAYENHGLAEIYVYHEGATGLICASCRADGMPPTGAASFTRAETVNYPRNVSADGQRIFFESPDQLTSADTNATVDVYEYEDGSQYLISSGKGSGDEYFAGASETGDDVIFSTNERLVSTDLDGSTDIYDARVDGASPAVSAISQCEGDSCQGRPSAQPPLVVAGSTILYGSGNGVTNAAPLKPTPKLKIKARKLAKGSRFTLSVGVPVPGTITFSGAAIKAGKQAVVRPAGYRLGIVLTAGARRRLRRKRRLTVSVKVKFAPANGASSTTTVYVTLKA